MYVYIHIYIYIERERDIYTHILHTTSALLDVLRNHVELRLHAARATCAAGGFVIHIKEI